MCSNWKSVRKGGPEGLRTSMCRCSAGRSWRFTYVNVQVFCGKIPKVYVRECAGVPREYPEGLHVWMCRCSAGRSRRFTYVNVQVFCGKIPKVYMRECAGVLREDPEGHVRGWAHPAFREVGQDLGPEAHDGPHVWPQQVCAQNFY